MFFFVGWLFDRTVSTVSSIMYILLVASSLGNKIILYFCLQTNLMPSRKFPCRTRFKKIWSKISVFWFPQAFPQVPPSRSVGVIYKFLKRSAVPQVELGIYSRANILVPVTRRTRCKITVWKTITSLVFHFQPRTPSNSAMSVEMNLFPNRIYSTS